MRIKIRCTSSFVHVSAGHGGLAGWTLRPWNPQLAASLAEQRTRTWTASAVGIERERTRQIARIGSGLSVA